MTSVGTVVAAAATQSGEPMTWFVLRSTGVVALVLLTVSVVCGILSPTWKPAARLAAISVHSTAAATGVVLLVAHVIFAVVDSYVDVSWLAVIVPGVSAWQPLWIGLGAAAVDLLAVIVITTALRGRAPVAWRKLHLLAYPAWGLAWLHAMTAGSDAKSQPMVILAVVTGLAVVVATTRRLRFRPQPVAPAPLQQQSRELIGGRR